MRPPNPVHGQYYIQTCQGLVISRLIGAWNVECARAFILDYRAAVGQTGLTRWARIADLCDFELAGPDTYVEFADFFAWATLHGCKSAAYYGATAAQIFASRKAFQLSGCDVVEPLFTCSVPELGLWVRAVRTELDIPVTASDSGYAIASDLSVGQEVEQSRAINDLLKELLA